MALMSARGWAYTIAVGLIVFGLQILIGSAWGVLAQIPLLVASPFLGCAAYMVGSDQADRRRRR